MRIIRVILTIDFSYFLKPWMVVKSSLSSELHWNIFGLGTDLFTNLFNMLSLFRACEDFIVKLIIALRNI